MLPQWRPVPIPSGRGEALSVPEAIAYTTRWIDIRLSPGEDFDGHQMRWLMTQLAIRALAETIKTGGDGSAYSERLHQSYTVLRRAQAALSGGKHQWWGSPAEDQARKAAERVMWQRRDPGRGYVEGYESRYQTSLREDQFNRCVADYLAQPWMRHPVLDWMLVDAIVTHELSRFGEAVKKAEEPGDPWRRGRYLRARGNLEELRNLKWKAEFQLQLACAAFFIVVPLLGIGAAFHFDWTITGIWLLGIYTLVVINELWSLVVKLIRRSVPGPESSSQTLWREMYEVWRLLEGPVVNPMLVGAELARTTRRGARWNSAAWSIVVRAMEHDPLEWVVVPAERDAARSDAGRQDGARSAPSQSLNPTSSASSS